MKKKILAVVSLCILILIVIFFYNVNDFNKSQQQYYVFSKEVSDSLLLRIEKNNIPYRIDELGQLTIQKKYEKKAVACCT